MTAMENKDVYMQCWPTQRAYRPDFHLVASSTELKPGCKKHKVPPDFSMVMQAHVNKNWWTQCHHL
jgi:hypothetical protein